MQCNWTKGKQPPAHSGLSELLWLGGSLESNMLVRGSWHRKTLTLQSNEAVRISKMFPVSSLKANTTATGLASPSTRIALVACPLFVLVLVQACHRRAHEHEQSAVECCCIALNRSINLHRFKHNLRWSFHPFNQYKFWKENNRYNCF